MKKAFMRTAEVAELLDYSHWQTCNLIRAGHIPGVKIGPHGHWRVPTAAVRALVRDADAHAKNDDGRAVTRPAVRTNPAGAGGGDGSG